MIDDYEQRIKMLPEVFDGKMNPEFMQEDTWQVLCLMLKDILNVMV